MNTFVTADPHYHHRNIIRYCNRPFLSDVDAEELQRRGGKWHDGDWRSNPWKISDESLEMMNRALVKETNRLVKRDDTLIIVGDYSLKPNKEKDLKEYYRKCREIRDLIHCQNVHLIKGNHDHDCIADLFSSYSVVLEGEYYGSHVVFSHHAFLAWNKAHRAAIHLYGHSHSEIEEWCDLFMPGRRSIDVGVDNAAKILKVYRPFNLQTEIVNVLSQRSGFSMNKHIPTNSTSPNEADHVD